MPPDPAEVTRQKRIDLVLQMKGKIQSISGVTLARSNVTAQLTCPAHGTVDYLSCEAFKVP